MRWGNVLHTFGRTRTLAALVLLPLLFGAASCHSYRYFDIHVRFDPATFDSPRAFRVKTCRVTVSGADSGSAIIPDGKCPNRTNTGDSLDAGVFEFSSFAESGMVSFRVQVFENIGEKPECILGEGTVSVPVGATTSMADLSIKSTGQPGCPNGPGPTNPDGG